jgi:hypothetical protein
MFENIFSERLQDICSTTLKNVLQVKEAQLSPQLKSSASGKNLLTTLLVRIIVHAFDTTYRFTDESQITHSSPAHDLFTFGWPLSQNQAISKDCRDLVFISHVAL